MEKAITVNLILHYSFEENMYRKRSNLAAAHHHFLAFVYPGRERHCQREMTYSKTQHNNQRQGYLNYFALSTLSKEDSETFKYALWCVRLDKCVTKANITGEEQARSFDICQD